MGHKWTLLRMKNSKYKGVYHRIFYNEKNRDYPQITTTGALKWNIQKTIE